MSFDMEGIGSEVSQKIRAAIKAKLIELGAYVDDELPDYIMVMVANKRTRSQMDEDLQLFLSSNTKVFTTWLHTVLQKLHEVTVATFEGKKQEARKSKEKKSEGEEGTGDSGKSEERVGKVKKHNKKHKESKKGKKSKHKSKEKVKLRSEKKHRKGESKEKSENEEENVKTKASQGDEGNEGKSKTSKGKMESNTFKEGAILGDSGKSEKLKSSISNSSRRSSCSSENSTNQKKKDKKETESAVPDSKMESVCLDEGAVHKKVENENVLDEVDGSSRKNKKELIEDEFNIEPLQPKDKPSDSESVKNKESVTDEYKTQTTISAPTEELLKVHDKLQNEKFEEEKKKNKKENEKSDSDDSLSPEEMRKQLLLNRAKKRLEESKLAERMKSNSPDILVEEVIRSDQNRESRSIPSKQAEPRSAKSSPPHSAFLSKDSSRVGSPNPRSRKLSPNSSDYRSQSPGRKSNTDYKSKQGCATEDKRRLISRDTSPARNSRSNDEGREKKKEIIKISESLEMEKKLVSKKDSEKESAGRKALSSRVVTISEPEAPEISSVVKVKPREFVAKEKQANKTLILKAVAEAEKSIATIPPKHKIEPPETKKREGLFTKDLRGKRLQNIEVTISKVSNSDALYRRISKDSVGQSDKSRTKHQISEVGEGNRKKSDLSCRKTSQSEDQFISSKTSGMEKNDKYIRCWLEGVEKAVKEDVMIDPNKIEDLVQSSITDEEREHGLEKHSKSDDVRKRKKPKSDDLSEGQHSKNPKKSEKWDDEHSPQIVVTMDGLNSKALKDILTKSKEGINGPLVLKQKDRKEKSGKVTERLTELPKEKSPSSSRNLTSEKISDRFGRLNPVNEVKDSERRKGVEKTVVYHSSERDKKESSNRELIARLSEKFGKVDREFESKKRKYSEADRRYQHESGRSQKDEYEKNGKYRRSDRKFSREDADVRVSRSRDRFKF